MDKRVKKLPYVGKFNPKNKGFSVMVGHWLGVFRDRAVWKCG